MKIIIAIIIIVIIILILRFESPNVFDLELPIDYRFVSF